MSIRINSTGYARGDSGSFLTGAAAGATSVWIQPLALGAGPSSGDQGILRFQYGGGLSTYFQPGHVARLAFTVSGAVLRTFNLALEVGTAYHFVQSYGPTHGWRIWINGVLSHTAAYGSTISAPNVVEVGPEGAINHDILIDDPAIWSGYELTEADVIALRDRTSTPTAIGGGTLGAYWTLDGTDAANVVWPSAGVQDSSGNNRVLWDISSPPPVYSATVPTYVEPPPPVVLRAARIGSSGKSLIVRLEDSDANLLSPTAIGALPTLTVNATPVTLLSPIWGAGTNHVLYPIDGTTISPANTVTLSAAAGWLVVGADVAPALTDEPVDRSGIGQPDFEVPTAPRTMQLGYNFGAPEEYATVFVYSNLLRQIDSAYFPGFSGDYTMTLAPDGSIGTFDGVAGSTVTQTISRTWTFEHEMAAGKNGYPSAPGGRYTLKWTGTSQILLRGSAQGNGTTCTLVGDDYNGTNKANTRTYDVSYETEFTWGAHIGLVYFGADYTDLEILPPDPEHPATLSLSGASKFHPEFLRMMAPAACIRFMDAIHTNGTNIRSYQDHMKAPRIWYNRSNPEQGEPLVHSRAITRVDPWTNDGFWDSANGLFMKFTTDGNHNFLDGDIVEMPGFTEPITVDKAGNPTVELGGSRVVRKVSDTEFAFKYYHESYSGDVIVARTFSEGGARRVISPRMPPDDLLELCDEVDADPWLCVPHLMDDASITAWASDVATWLSTQPTSRKVFVEYSNEVWNFLFHQTEYAYGMARTANPPYGSQMGWYAFRSGQIHQLFEAALETQQAGLGNRLQRVYGSQAVNPGITTSLVSEVAARGYRLDVLSFAAYYVVNHLQPAVNNQGATWDALDVDQVHDLDAASLELPLNWYAAQRAVLDDLYDHAALGFPRPVFDLYEGGFEALTYQGTRIPELTLSWVRHPRMYNHALRFFQLLQAEEIRTFNYFMLSGLPFLFNDPFTGVATFTIWPVYTAWNQPSGIGDGSDGKFNNLSDLTKLDELVSPIGGAFETWMGPQVVLPPEPPAPPGAGVNDQRPLRLSPRRQSQQTRSLFRPHRTR